MNANLFVMENGNTINLIIVVKKNICSSMDYQSLVPAS